jgi:ubiquinone/menaquinone biosynthesis C-methylase UbiE
LAVVPTSSQIESFLDLLRCPASGQPLHVEDGSLITADLSHRYRLSGGIAMLAEHDMSTEAAAQGHHYDKIAAAYTANLGYAHTQEYLAYLDRVFFDAVGERTLGTTVELCCGRGEALGLFGTRIDRYLGVDVSERMLIAATAQHDHPNALFVQGDATRVPVGDCTADNVVILGGIHHVVAREKLFAEVERILKPGGRFFYREPVSDFFLWRMLRSLIYRVSPLLNHDTERPLIFEETVPVMQRVGLRSAQYNTHGFIGFCLFMNSDVLVFNRLFRHAPGIRQLVRASARLDEAILTLPGFSRAGLQVIGVAEKPMSS